MCAVITQHSLQTPPQVRLQSAGWMLERWVSPDACRTDSSAPHSKARSDRNSGCEVIPTLNGEIQTGERNHNQRLEELTETTKRAKFVADRTVNLNVAESFLLSLAAQFCGELF